MQRKINKFRYRVHNDLSQGSQIEQNKRKPIKPKENF